MKWFENLKFSLNLNAEKKMMRKSFSLFSFRLFMIAGLMTSMISVSGQTKNLAVGAGVGFNFTPVMEYDQFWDHYSMTANFTPSLTLRYGNKISGVFKASYILNTFKHIDFSQYGGTMTDKVDIYIHQIYFDLLFEHTPFGSKGFYYYLGPGFGIPVKVRATEDYWRGEWGPDPEVQFYEETFPQADFNLCIQGVFGIGGYIPVKEKNLISLECNVRYGLNKVMVNIEGTEEVRMVAIQFILGYLRRL